VHPAARLARQGERIRALGRGLVRAFAHDQRAAGQRVRAVRARLVRELRTPFREAGRLDTASRALTRGGRERLARATRDVEHLASALALLNPSAVLERGYAIVAAHDGRVISDVRDLDIGDDVALTLARGRAHASVTGTDPGDTDQG
jgi:exodeoxyribonuclease VII large subunit